MTVNLQSSVIHYDLNGILNKSDIMKTKNDLPIFSLLVCFLLLSIPAWTQNHIIHSDSLYSTNLKEQRQIQVIFPQQYNPDSKDSLDVLYVLDGEWNTPLSKTVIGFLEYAQFVPTNVLIVSVPNNYKEGENMRGRDFTPTRVEKRSPISGGADNFLLFLKEELVPFVNKNYPINVENNILYGTSYGGLFAIYAYLLEPSLFKSYLTVEPSLMWDNYLLIKIASERLEKIIGTNNTLWIGSRDGMAFEEMGISKFDSLLNLKAPEGLHWNVETYPNETHFSAIWKGLYDGLKFTYTQSKVDGEIVNRANTNR